MKIDCRELILKPRTVHCPPLGSIINEHFPIFFSPFVLSPKKSQEEGRLVSPWLLPWIMCMLHWVRSFLFWARWRWFFMTLRDNLLAHLDVCIPLISFWFVHCMGCRCHRVRVSPLVVQRLHFLLDLQGTLFPHLALCVYPVVPWFMRWILCLCYRARVSLTGTWWLCIFPWLCGRKVLTHNALWFWLYSCLRVLPFSLLTKWIQSVSTVICHCPLPLSLLQHWRSTCFTPLDCLSVAIATDFGASELL